MAKKRPPRLLVVFDTNALYTQVASDLIQTEVRRIISENSNHPDLEVEWYLPEVVIGERSYQMLTKAKELLPNLKKLERLLGHSFGIGEDTLQLHVDNAIAKSIEALKFKKLQCDTAKVDWESLIARSINRKPPFEASEKEKGFRDSLIANSFIQLLNASPSTPNICRLVFVTNDLALREYVAELSKDAKNVRIISKIDELESLLNTLISTVPEELVNELTEKAAKLFFEKKSDNTLYYKEKIKDKIKKQFAKQLIETKLPGRKREGGTWWISDPIFIKKEQQRIFWVTPIESEFKIFHYEDKVVVSTSSADDQTGLLLNEPELSLSSKITNTIGLLTAGLNKKEVIDLQGREKFEVHWSTSLSQAQNLTTPRIEKITHVGDEIDESSS